MKKNILYSFLGILAGFFLGFYIANIGGRARPATSAARTSAQASDQLPPGHPGVDGAGGSPAANSAQAQAAMDEADRNPKEFVSQIRAAAFFYQLNDLRKAELYLNRALALKPDDPDALTGMGHTKYDTGDFVAAAGYYEKALAQRPDDADMRTDLGNTYVRRANPDYARAITEYRKALEVNPRHENALARMADAALKKGDSPTAREAIDRLAAVNPSNQELASLRSKLQK